MKQLLFSAILITWFSLGVLAQQPATETDSKAAIAAQKKADRANKKAAKDASIKDGQTTKSTGTNKDGSPDMRLKKNKDAAKANQANSTVTSPAANEPAANQNSRPNANPQTPSAVGNTPNTQKSPAIASPQPITPVISNSNTPNNVTPSTNASGSVKTTDKAVGTDAKGRTIYEGSRGGHYYINKNGNKEYIKKVQ